MAFALVSEKSATLVCCHCAAALQRRRSFDTNALNVELDQTVMHCIYESVDNVVEVAAEGLISHETMHELFKRIAGQVESLVIARADREKEADEEDLDEEDLEQLQEVEAEEDELLEQVISAIGALLKRFGDAALEPVEALVQKHFIAFLMEQDRSYDDRWLALLLISDMIDHAPSSSKHVPPLMPKFLEYATTDNKELMQVCCYCLGVVAEKHPQVFADQHGAALDVLTKVLKATSGKEDWGSQHDNAAAAIGKVLVHQPAVAQGDVGMQLGQLWVNALPLVHDETEATVQHRILQGLLEKSDARVLGENQANLAKIADVFVRVIAKGSELLDEGAVPGFQAFFFSQLLPVLQKGGFALQPAVQALPPQDQQRFVEAAKANGVGA